MSSQVLVPVGLFIVTVITTLWSGAYQVGVDPLENPLNLLAGIPFSFTLLVILLTHEMGHYLTARWHRVPASLPLFIPGPPFFIGTFGAIIRMRGPILSKRALFDIGVSGPIAGFVLAVGAIYVGLHYSNVVKVDGQTGIHLGTPIMFELISQQVIGAVPEGYDVMLHPIAFAGWLGLFLTALNLIPIGQLDGGHVAYAMYGRRQPVIAALLVLPILFYLGALSVFAEVYPWMEDLPGAPGWPGWMLWAALPLILGIHHPPVLDEYVPLDGRRRLIGWAAIAIFIVTFVPAPFHIP